MLFSGKARLTEAQRRIYRQEKGFNFREIAHVLCTRSTHTLTASDIVSDPSGRAASLASRLASWGEFAEISHGELDPSFILREIDTLSSEGGVYEDYNALKAPGVQCLGVFRGPGIAGEQGYIAFRPGGPPKEGEENVKDELVISFSGTSSLWQVIHDLDTRRAKYQVPSLSRSPFLNPTSREATDNNERKSKKGSARVHKGFWRLYTGLRPSLSKVLSSALDQYPNADLVITGHSMGATMCYLLACDILLESVELGSSGNAIEGRKITIAAFGCPRVGDASLVKLFNDAAQEYRAKFGAERFSDYSVKAFDDGAHCLPPRGLGYRHMCQTPLYLYHGNLYRIPTGDSESSFFNVESSEAAESMFPLGGHNYYNNRNMEKPINMFKRLKLKTLGEHGWRGRYDAIKEASPL